MKSFQFQHIVKNTEGENVEVFIVTARGNTIRDAQEAAVQKLQDRGVEGANKKNVRKVQPKKDELDQYDTPEADVKEVTEKSEESTEES